MIENSFSFIGRKSFPSISSLHSSSYFLSQSPLAPLNFSLPFLSIRARIRLSHSPLPLFVSRPSCLHIGIPISSPIPSHTNTNDSAAKGADLPRSNGTADVERRDEMIDSMLRVDHAGEYGALRIYAGQIAALKVRQAFFPNFHSSQSNRQHQHQHQQRQQQQQDQRNEQGNPDVVRLLESMRASEQVHLTSLESLMPERRVRPSVLLPFWDLTGYSLGYLTGILGERAAMACTAAVEEVITGHYNDQLRILSSEARYSGPEYDDLRALIKKHRDEEEDHKEIGLANEAELAPFYSQLSGAIKLACHASIWLAKRF